MLVWLPAVVACHALRELVHGVGHGRTGVVQEPYSRDVRPTVLIVLQVQQVRVLGNEQYNYIIMYWLVFKQYNKKI